MDEKELLYYQKLELEKQRKERVTSILLGTLGILLFLAIWQAVVSLKIVNTRIVASPINVVKCFITKLTNPNPEGAVMYQHVLSSLKISLSGYCLAVCIGVPLGLLMGWYKPVNKIVGPLFSVLRPLPPIAWIPFTVIFLGIGALPKAVIIFLSAFIPCLINSQAGIRLCDKTYINVARTCGATNWETFIKVGVPTALPMVFAGMRTALGNSWSTLVAAEMLAANMGLGYMISMGRTFGRIDIIMVGMLSIGVFGILLTKLFDAIEKRLLKWRNVQ